MIRMNTIKKVYCMGDVRQTVLNELNLNIKEGEMVAIMGTSGSGKTTLLNIIGLLDEVTEGEYYLNGCDMTKYSDKEKAEIRNREIGFVFQNFHLIRELTALENVKISMDINNLYAKKKVSQKEMYERCKEMLVKVGLENELAKKPSQLSGGQKQRVAIARALINRPKVILSDEPTGALDMKTTNEIMELFRNLNSEGHTILVVTHDVAVAGKCERKIKIEDGVILE